MSYDFSKFQMDPRWETHTMRQSHPRSPQAIFYDGVLVGYRHDPDRGLPEHVKAIGNDSAIQEAVEAFYRRWRAEKDAAREADVARWRAEGEAEKARRVADARRALFGEQ